MTNQRLPQWDKMVFTSYISVRCEIQMITVDKENRMVSIVSGVFKSQQTDMSLTEKLICEFEECFEKSEMNKWHKWCFNPSCDGERWQFQFYQNGREVASKEGSCTGKTLKFHNRNCITFSYPHLQGY